MISPADMEAKARELAADCSPICESDGCVDEAKAAAILAWGKEMRKAGVMQGRVDQLADELASNRRWMKDLP